MHDHFDRSAPVIGVLADSGLAFQTAVACNSADLQVFEGSLPQTDRGEIDVAAGAHPWLRERGLDHLVYVTELPLTAAERGVLRRTAEGGTVSVVSLPSLGCVRTKARLRSQIDAIIHGIRSDGVMAEAPAELMLRGPAKGLRLLCGMIRCNRPGTLLKALSGCLAAVAATGGFGIFYASIWNMAHTLSLLRLGFTAMFSVAVLSGWLIGYNGMWHMGRSVSPWRRRLDNLSTLGTVVLAVSLIYLAAVAGMLMLTLVVVPPHFLSEQIGDAVNLGTYVEVAWFAGCLGTMGGALGANFDSSVRVRTATYSEREYERRQRSGYYNRKGDTSGGDRQVRSGG